jgi:putative aminopeptidase FrvX
MTEADSQDRVSQLTELSALPAPCGAEEPVAAWLGTRLEESSVEAAVDALGNLVTTTARRPRVLVVAHMDQVGYVVSGVGSGGARALPLGGPQVEPGATVPVQIFGEGHPPIAGELMRRRDRGADIRTDRLDMVAVGDRAVFARALEARNGRVRGPALDNRIGCLIALEAARELAATPGVAFAWTVREESEPAGVMRVARELDPEVVVVVDITYASSGDGADSRVAVGEGPAITLLDGGMTAHRGLTAAFDRSARAIGVDWQREVVSSGVSEAGHVQRLLGIPALPLLVPVADPHTDRESASLADVDAAARLLRAGLGALTG